MKRVAFLIAIVAVAASSVAFAAKPVRGARYRGTITRSMTNITFPIAFKVSKNGKKVSAFDLPNAYPVYCQGGGFPGLTKGGSARITNKARFTAKLPLTNALSHKPEGFVIVTGTFTTGGAVSGKVKTDLPGSFGKTCDGTSLFTARA
jgi:hypothetical protein